MTTREELLALLREARKWWGEPICKEVTAGRDPHVTVDDADADEAAAVA